MHLARKASGRCWTTIDLVRRGGGWRQRSRFFAWNGATIVIVIVVVATSLPLWQHRYANRSSRRRIWYYLEHSDGQSSGSIEERLGRLMGIRWGGVRTEHGEWEAGIGADHGCFFRCVSWRVKESGTVLSNEVMLRRGGICLCGCCVRNNESNTTIECPFTCCYFRMNRGGAVSNLYAFSGPVYSYSFSTNEKRWIWAFALRLREVLYDVVSFLFAT